MFRNTYQRGFLTVFSSSGSKPLEIWDVVTKNGHTKRKTDEDLKLMVFELMGANVATTYMVAPRCPCPSLGVKLPFLVLLLKNLKKFFSFEIQILDDRNLLRRFRASNYQSATRVDNFCTVMPLALTPGWNQIQFNLADFTRRAYGTNYIETVRIQIHANVRVRRIYFCDRLYTDDQIPPHLRLHPPLRPCKISDMAGRKGKKPAEPIETVRPPTPVKETERQPNVEVLVPAPAPSRAVSIVEPLETAKEPEQLETATTIEQTLPTNEPIPAQD
ncbi:cilia- and flagella-associated protein 20-like [Sabethes cyaneus]|uniref:cilia- and flagella-associated protein 20-like n=1 Tax=Sabethes cyaneus TaxID=53552 RepID=UPI00237DD802|nr:cilia- and flagella-associated protein 20-like [Sabethes cyaneus]